MNTGQKETPEKAQKQAWVRLVLLELTNMPDSIESSAGPISDGFGTTPTS